jgi:hypothetical protein
MDPLYSSPSEVAESQLSEAQTMELFAYFLQKLPEGTDTRQFTNIHNLRKILEDRKEALEKDKTRNQFLVFTNVRTIAAPLILLT